MIRHGRSATTYSIQRPAMAASALGSPLHLFFFFVFLFSISQSSQSPSAPLPAPTPTPWPPQFHALIYQNFSGALPTIDLWYDWPKGRNFNIIQQQLGQRLYDLEWTNGTSFYYTLTPADPPTCYVRHFDVGILPPDWLAGARYLGRQTIEGFLCDVWEKVDFILYYEDVVTKRPVHWLFYNGQSMHLMTFEVGAVLEDENWQAPAYCFGKDQESQKIRLASSASGMRSKFSERISKA